MNHSIEISQSNNQYVRQFNRAVLDYEIFILEERQQKKQGQLKTRGKVKIPAASRGIQYMHQNRFS
jgi:hypothetical protein